MFVIPVQVSSPLVSSKSDASYFTQKQVTELFKQMREQGGLIGQQAGGYGPTTAVGVPLPASSPTSARRRMPPRSQSSAANLTSLCADISPSSSHFFEVLYIGKIKVSHKKVPDSFIDDAIEKFRVHEENKLKEKLLKESKQQNQEEDSSDIRRGSIESTTSDTGSTDSFSTRNLILATEEQQHLNINLTNSNNNNNNRIIIKSLSDSSNLSNQIVGNNNNNNNNINNNNNNNNNTNTNTLLLLHISDAESTPDNIIKTKDNIIPSIIQTEYSNNNTFNNLRVQRTISESSLNDKSNLPDSLNNNNINISKFNSKSFENVPLAVEKATESNQLNLITSPIQRRFGSIEALPTVVEDLNKENKTDKPRQERLNSAADILVKKTDNSEHNRTMVFQVGRFDLRLISPDRKQILLHKQLKDVATCIQGLQNTDHFGFICRELNNDTFMGYIFKCESDSVAVDVVQAIKQSFNATNEHYKRERAPIISCEHCPMVWYHKLCAEIENQSDRRTQAMIFKRLQFLEDDEQNAILAKFRGAEADSTREQNEFLMMLLRAHCEAKQVRHIHDTAENRSEFLNQYLGGSTIFMKAKRSLTNSFDHLLKRKGSRDDFGPQLKEMNANLSREVSPQEKFSQSLEVPPVDIDPTTSSPYRSRTSTLSSVNGDDKSPTSSISGDISERNQLKSPMMDIFFKVGSSPKSPSKDDASEKVPPVTSWRQEMFNRVVTPNKTDNLQGSDMKKLKRSREELRELWKTAIRQAMLLKRMEKENDRLTARQEESAVKRIKLEYDEISPCRRDVVNVWDQIAKKESRIANKVDHNILLQAIRQGVPRSKRGDVWQFLAHQFCIKQQPFDSKCFPNYNTPYEDLLKQLTSHQHAILIDLGRTFPNHTYYSSPLGPGQLALFNILKAYSLLDPEVGYCQGLSFVAGVLLLHIPESEAFFLLRHLMFRRGMRTLYLPDMEALQVHLYQLSRLLHDKLPELYEHFSIHDVAPTLYAAPWILTIFASQFPLGFVARVFDIIFLDNSDVVFRVAIGLLSIHKDNLLSCDCFEEIMDYLKTTLPVIDERTMNDVMRSVFCTDIAADLAEYKVEYHVLQEEMASVRPQLDSLARMEQQNRQLIEDNKRLMEQLEIAVSNTQRMEQTRSVHQTTINRLETRIRGLEVTVDTLGSFINTVIEKKIDIEIPGDVRRIVSQISLSERRLNNNNQIPSMKKLEPPKYMVKSLSMSKLGLNFNKNSEPIVPRSHSVNVNISNTIAQNLKNDSGMVRKNSLLNSVNESLNKMETKGHRGYPLRVIDDNTVYQSSVSVAETSDKNQTKLTPKYPLKTALSQPIISINSKSFFANSHNQIQQQRLKTMALKQGYKDVNTLLETITNEPTTNQLTEKCVSLPLNMKNQRSDRNNKTELITDVSSDSGISTPVSPANSDHTMSEIPLFDSDVHCTFNGTTKLKSIKTGIKCTKS